MSFTGVNFAAVFVSGAAMWVLGALWYAALFGKRWAKLVGMHNVEAMKSRATMNYIYTFIANLVIALVMAAFLSYTVVTTAMDGATTAFWAWLGFVLPTGVINSVWIKKPMELFLIDYGYCLVGMVVIGAILGSWR